MVDGAAGDQTEPRGTGSPDSAIRVLDLGFVLDLVRRIMGFSLLRSLGPCEFLFIFLCALCASA